MSDNRNRLPQIIKDYTDNLNNPKTNQFTRETYALMLELIRDEADKALKKYYEQRKHRRT